MYQPHHLSPAEVLPGLTGDETWESLDPELRNKLDDRMLETADEIFRVVGHHFEANDYTSGGVRDLCGYIPPECDAENVGTLGREGKALKLYCLTATADAVRKVILEAVDRGELPYLGALKLNVPYVLFDVRERVDGKVQLFA